MEEKNDKIFKCANDLKVSVTKLNGEILMNEDCCTMIQLVLKNTGEMATSFFGSHNPQVLNVLEKALKGYFKSMKKTLKKEFKRDDNEEIQLIKDELPPDGTWEDVNKNEETLPANIESKGQVKAESTSSKKVLTKKVNSKEKTSNKSQSKKENTPAIKSVKPQRVSPDSPSQTIQKSKNKPAKKSK